jgi:hypothetical protein
LVLEVELLSEVVTGFVACVCYVHWEGYFLEACAAVLDAPGYAD